jgi:hypothetical protein
VSKLPLRAAYEFARMHDLDSDVRRIKSRFGTNKMRLGSYTSSITRGWIITLFQSRGIFDDFCLKHWPYYQTKSGKKEAQRYLRLIIEAAFGTAKSAR